jgi:putative PIN family toxin of toxin-antitoxin system
MASVVFDASSLVGALLNADSIPEQALHLARANAVICLSREVSDEIQRVFSRPKFRAAAHRSHLILQIIGGSAVWHQPRTKVADCRDAKDNKYLELALEAGADTIVSSDADLLVLHPWRGISIVRPAEYVARFQPAVSPPAPGTP